MTSTARGLTDIDRAHEAATRAAQRSGVDVVELKEVGELKETARLFSHIWATDEDRPPISSDLLRAFSHNGNYVAAAKIGGRIVGASVGFLALEDGCLKLHSHITGIAPDSQGRSVGSALKQHQRLWALSRGIDTITWTFDPLVRRNAWFNLVKLGASITAYHPHFYGAMEDGVNAGDESDRCVVEWRLDSESANRAGDGSLPELESDALLAGGATLSLGRGSAGEPLLNGSTGDTRLCWVPDDIVAVRVSNRDLALSWRRALREAFTDALGAGLQATGMTRDGCYVLTASASA